jgi:hypothetical protein
VTGNSCTTTGGAGTYYVQDANGNQSNKDST